MCVRLRLYGGFSVSEALDSTLFEANGHPSPPSAKEFVRDFADGQAVESCFLVRERDLRKRRNGDDYLKLVLADATGRLAGVCWEDADRFHDLAEPGAVVHVRGRFAIDRRYGPQLTVDEIKAADDGDYQLTDLLDAPAMDVAQMESELRQLIETVRDT